MSYTSSPLAGHGYGTVPPPSAPGISGILPGQQAVNTTRILSLTGFSKELKTRDIQNIFADWEDDRGGYRIKWLDDTGCLVVFSEPITAKKAFLSLLANPHPHLLPSTSEVDGESVAVIPKLAPYTGEDVGQIVASVANRPRSRSIASNNNPNSTANSPSHHTHGRRMSSGHGHGRMSGSISSGSLNGIASGSLGRSSNLGRASMSQSQMRAIMDEANSAVSSGADAGSTSNGNGNTNGNGTSSSATSEDTSTNNSAAAAASIDRAASPPSPTSGNNMPNGGAIDWTSYQASQQQQQQQQQGRPRNNSGSNGASGLPASPDTRQLPGGGAISPTRLRRVIRS